MKPKMIYVVERGYERETYDELVGLAYSKRGALEIAAAYFLPNRKADRKVDAAWVTAWVRSHLRISMGHVKGDPYRKILRLKIPGSYGSRIQVSLVKVRD